MGLFGISSLTWVLAEVMKEPHGRKGKLVRARFKLAPFVDRVAHALNDWPKNFRQFLHDTYEPLLSAQVIPAFTTLFNWARIRLSTSFEKRGIDARFVVEEVYRFAASHWSSEKLLYKGDASNLMPSVLNWVSLPESSRMSGLSTRAILALMEEGIVPFKISGESRDRRNMMIDIRWVQSKQPSNYPTVHIRKAADQVGLSQKTVLQLRAQGIFPDRHHVQYTCGFALEDLTAFRKSLNTIVSIRLDDVPANATTLLGTFGNIVVGARQRAELIKALLDGRIHPIGRIGDDPHDIILARADVMQFVNNTSPVPVAPSITRFEAKRMLGGTYRTIGGLIDNGYLRLIDKPNWKEISVESIEEFDKTFITTSRLCEMTKLSSSSMRELVREAGIDVVWFRTRKSRSGLVRREDLQKLLNNVR
jgi:hypothetical protein